MPEEKDIKKIERRAKSLLLSKDIPPEKMEIVRTLMNNKSLSDEERFSAMIELIQTCPDKPVKGPLLTSIELKESKKGSRKTPMAHESPPAITPSLTSAYIDDIHKNYKKYGIFKKRYLIRSGNKIGFWFKKRLIPTKKILKIFSDINSFKDNTFSLLTEVLESMLLDKHFNDIASFNYLSKLKTQIGTITLPRYSYDTIRWMEREDFERELKEFSAGYLAYFLLPVETKEHIIRVFETSLANMDGFRKAVINERDSDKTKREKEKFNLEAEKKKYSAILGIRTFFPSEQNSECALSYRLKSEYGVPSLPWLLLAAHEALVLHRELKFNELIAFYKSAPITVKDDSYFYDTEALKKYGKDDESLRKSKIESIKEELGHFEEIYLLLKMELSGENLLLKSHDDQWRIIDKRRGDSSEVFKTDFIAFIDGLVNYFKNFFLHVLDGSILFFETNAKEAIEGRIFDASFFEWEIREFDEISKEFYYFRTNNPNMIIPYDELQKIFKGQIKSMISVGMLLKKIGGVFYHFAKALHEVIDGHKNWARRGKPSSDVSSMRVPLDKASRDSELKQGLRTLPFHDCRFKAFHEPTPLSKSYAGQCIINQDFNDGLLMTITAFCYQVAYECGNDEILADIEERKKILKTLRELSDKP
jgi:hypothetical protein